MVVCQARAGPVPAHERVTHARRCRVSICWLELYQRINGPAATARTATRTTVPRLSSLPIYRPLPDLHTVSHRAHCATLHRSVHASSPRGADALLTPVESTDKHPLTLLILTSTPSRLLTRPILPGQRMRRHVPDCR